MPPERCADCGKEDPYIEQHHVFGRKVDPHTIVPLCHYCHQRMHRGMLLFGNSASDRFAEWLQYEEKLRFVPWHERLAKLQEYGYVPLGDEWIDMQDADLETWLKILIREYYESLRIYLTQNIDRSDLWERALKLVEG